MAKKTFVRRARVVKGSRWYIDYTIVDGSTGEETRRRQGFDLDDIADLQVREQVAERLARYLDSFISESPAPSSPAGPVVSIRAALEQVLEMKVSGPRPRSGDNYRTVVRYLVEWLGKSGAARPVGEFDRRKARQFKEYLKGRQKYTGRTINNYMNCCRTLWNDMHTIDLVEKNPWTDIKPERQADKRRRVFTQEERRVVAEELRANHYFLFRAVLLLYYCYIRPAEMVRLRRLNFDLQNGLIHIDAGQAKMWKARTVTFPEKILPYFKDGIFDRIPAGHYIFGQGWAPQAAAALGNTRLFKAHRKVLKKLHELGALKDITGLTLYSWKDTGISTHARATSPLATRDQAGHSDLSQTMQYYHARRVNEEYRKVEDDLIG